MWPRSSISTLSNAKKRYRYWVERETRIPSTGLSKAAGRNLTYCGTKAISLRPGESYTMEVRFALGTSQAAPIQSCRQLASGLGTSFSRRCLSFLLTTLN